MYILIQWTLFYSHNIKQDRDFYHSSWLSIQGTIIVKLLRFLEFCKYGKKVKKAFVEDRLKL
jgi:hypothetical protein